MDKYNVPAYPVSNEDLKRDGGYYDVNGLWNSIKVLEDGSLVRHRVETFIFKETEDNKLQVYLRRNYDGGYRLPGGSITKGVSDKVQAALECEEEARIKVKDIEYTGVHYVRKYDNLDKFVKDPALVSWVGSYNDVYAGFYDGPYIGEVKDLDQDNDMYKFGKFYDVDSKLIESILPEHKPIFDRLKEVGLLENSDMEVAPGEYTKNDKANRLCNFAFDFLTRLTGLAVTIYPRDHEFINDSYVVADYKVTSDAAMLGFIAILNELNNTTTMKDMYKDDNFGVVIPAKNMLSGTLYLRDDMVAANENTLLNNTDNKPVYKVEEPKEDWIDSVKKAYDDYHVDKSDDNRARLTNLGWNPESELPFEESVIAAEAILNSVSEQVVSIDEKYLFSEKDGYYNFDKWDSGESNIMLITGLSGSGKSTLAKSLVKEYKAVYIQLDEFQCYNVNKDSNTPTNRLIKLYLKENPYKIDPAKFSELAADDFSTYFIPFFDWLVERLSTDKDNRYIIEGLHICLFIPYDEIKGIPLYCINASMTKSIIRHWIRDGWGFGDFVKHGLVDIKLFKEWEKDYSDFRDSIGESSEIDTKEYGLSEKKKYPLLDKKHVLSAIKFFNYVDKEDEKELAANIIKKMNQYKIDHSHVGEKNRLNKYL